MSIFPDSWVLEEANKLCSHIVDCINKTAPLVDYETAYKMIRTTNVKHGRINLEQANCVDEATFIKWNRRLTPQKNDIVLTREAPLGDVGLIRTDQKIFLGQRTMIYRANKEKLNQHFLYYSLLGPTLQAQIKTLGSGSTVEHVRVPDAEKLIIPHPSLKEQKKIAGILSAYDELIENNKSRITLLEKMAEEIYHEWFVRFRFPGYQSTEFERGIPCGWERKSIGSFCRFMKGKNPDHVALLECENFSPYINVELLSGKCKTYAKIQRGSVLCKMGDLLMLMDGSRSGKVFKANANGILGSTFSIIHVDEREKNYLYEYLKAMNEAIVFNNTGSAIPHANKDYINRMIVCMPKDEAIMSEFNDLYNRKYSLIKNLNEQINRLEEIKKLLFTRLISGKFSVENLDIQFPPSMLEAETG